MHRDFVEMLAALNAADAEYLVVRAHAMAVHGLPRATGDLDLWVRPTAENARRVRSALRELRAPIGDLTVEDLAKPEIVFQMGVPPVRIDLLTTIDGVDFDSAWPRRKGAHVEARRFPSSAARTSSPTSGLRGGPRTSPTWPGSSAVGSRAREATGSEPIR